MLPSRFVDLMRVRMYMGRSCRWLGLVEIVLVGVVPAVEREKRDRNAQDVLPNAMLDDSGDTKVSDGSP